MISVLNELVRHVLCEEPVAKRNILMLVWYILPSWFLRYGIFIVWFDVLTVRTFYYAMRRRGYRDARNSRLTNRCDAVSSCIKLYSYVYSFVDITSIQPFFSFLKQVLSINTNYHEENINTLNHITLHHMMNS